MRIVRLFTAHIVLVQPEITVELVDQLENETNPTSFMCQATGEPVPNISWYFNDIMINVSDTNKYMVMSTSINITTFEGRLEVFNAASYDVGTYVCIATNELGSDRSVGVLTVNGKKMFCIMCGQYDHVMSCYYRCC